MAMEKKGLCSSCVNDKECTFLRKFPVLQCEEFTGCELKPTKTEKRAWKKIRFNEEPTIWE